MAYPEPWKTLWRSFLLLLTAVGMSVWASGGGTITGLAFGEESAKQDGNRPTPPDGYYDAQMPAGFKRVPFPVIPTAAQIEEGRRVYFTKCVWCHGVEGAGDGPSADRLFPRPRNFTQGTFKIRHTASGELPLIEDLFETVTHGLPGSVMPSWEGVLSEEQRRAVVAFITTQLVKDRKFSDTDLETFTALQLKDIKPLPQTPESIAKGAKLFVDKKCIECHGAEGRGDGNPINLKDDWAFPIQPRDLHKCWLIRGSRRDPYNRLNIFRTFSTGLNGTPMPSFADNTTIEERWHLANFVNSLCERDEHGNPLEIDRATNRAKVSPMISAEYIQGGIPDDPESPAWKKAVRRWVGLAGQVTHKPRNFVTRVDDVWVQALYNDTDIAFLMRWDDRIKDVASGPLPWKPTEVNLEKYGVTEPPPRTGSNDLTSKTLAPLQEYQVIAARSGEAGSLAKHQHDYTTYNDAVAVQFPIQWKGQDVAHPRFARYLWGDAEHPVDLMKWSSDGTLAAFKGAGWDRDFQERAFTKSLKLRKAEFKDGRWTVILQRPLKGASSDDASLELGALIPVVFFGWDGHNGDAGRKMSVSTTYYLLLQPKSGAVKLDPPPVPQAAGVSVPATFKAANPLKALNAGDITPFLPDGGGPARLIKATGNPWVPSANGYLKAVREGGSIYFQNCHFCHADNLNGGGSPTTGFWAFGSLPQPTNFATGKRLDQMTELYAFWRVAKGGLGLPHDNPLSEFSTMPAMEEHLAPEDMWKIVLFMSWQTGAVPKESAIQQASR